MTPREQSNGPAPAKRDHRQEVTDSIVKMLGDGVAPWQKPWESAGLPFNPTTDKAYRGGNAIHLMATGLSRGYEDLLDLKTVRIRQPAFLRLRLHRLMLHVEKTSA